MSIGRRENFHFEQTPMLVTAAGTTLDGTTNQQNVGSFTQMACVNGSVYNAYCEPEQVRTSGNEGAELDNLSRLIVIASAPASALTWSGELEIRRSSATSGVVIPVNFIGNTGTGSDNLVQVFDNPLPVDFAKSGTGSALTDFVEAQFRVTPNVPIAIPVMAFAALVPGFAAGDSNKGAELSAAPYLKP